MSGSSPTAPAATLSTLSPVQGTNPSRFSTVTRTTASWSPGTATRTEVEPVGSTTTPGTTWTVAGDAAAMVVSAPSAVLPSTHVSVSVAWTPPPSERTCTAGCSSSP